MASVSLEKAHCAFPVRGCQSISCRRSTRVTDRPNSTALGRKMYGSTVSPLSPHVHSRIHASYSTQPVGSSGRCLVAVYGGGHLACAKRGSPASSPDQGSDPSYIAICKTRIQRESRCNHMTASPISTCTILTIMFITLGMGFTSASCSGATLSQSLHWYAASGKISIARSVRIIGNASFLM
jgi:hypothetical protein